MTKNKFTIYFQSQIFGSLLTRRRKLKWDLCNVLEGISKLEKRERILNFKNMEDSHKIFIVDDDLFCRKIYQQHLISINNYDISCYCNGNDCINNLFKEPDIILLDYYLTEELNGFEVLKKIKRYNPDIFIVMISGQESIKAAVDVLKYGAFDYIVKDDNVCDNISRVIDKIIKVRAELRKLNPNFTRKLLRKL